MEKTIMLTRRNTAVASIDANHCVNCGMCRDYCPADAISERQKVICHLCPDCTERKAITPDQMIELQNEACTLACPLGLSPQGFINLLKNGRKRQAFEIIWKKNPLPATTGYVCHHPCQDVCKRGTLVDRPMEIRAIQRFLSEDALGFDPDPYPVIFDERIAVIGAGPAGLSAAHSLSHLGYKVTVFEQSNQPGGMLMRGIPAFRADKEIIRKEIGRLEKAGLEIICNTKIPNDYTELLKDFDRVVVSVGTQISKELPIPGAVSENVTTALHLMEKVNAGQTVDMSGFVVVLGGGSVAVDAARTAVRCGADRVVMICLESGDQIPAHKWELDEAREEGIEIIESATATRIFGGSYSVDGIEYAKICNLNTSNFSFEKVEGSEQTLPATKVIFAIGQRTDLKWPEHPQAIFAGDCAAGKCSVIDAIASGRNAAIQIDNDLRKREYEDYKIDRSVEKGDLAYKIYPAVRRKITFPVPEILSAHERKTSFEVVEKVFNAENAGLETIRCLECGYEYVDAEKCIGCGVCRKVCPMGNVISMVRPLEEN